MCGILSSDAMQCRGYQHFRGTCCIHLQGWSESGEDVACLHKETARKAATQTHTKRTWRWYQPPGLHSTANHIITIYLSTPCHETLRTYTDNVINLFHKNFKTQDGFIQCLPFKAHISPVNTTTDINILGICYTFSNKLKHSGIYWNET
jgi:hypothetical protein